jgi:hypothetical protein
MPHEDAIVLDDRLTRTERRCVLAHELAHPDLGHMHQAAGSGPGTGRIARRDEEEADQLAARRLIALGDMADAAVSASCRYELAESLDVTAELLAVRIQHLHPAERGAVTRRLANREHAC